MAPPALPSASLRSGVVSHMQGLGSLPAPPVWSAARLSSGGDFFAFLLVSPLFALVFVVLSLAVVVSLCLSRRSARLRFRSSDLSVNCLFLQLLPYLSRFLCPWIYEDF